MRRTAKTSAFASLVVLTAAAAIATSFSLASCATAPTPVPVRTFERAQNVDFVCMHVLTDPDPVNPTTEYFPVPIPVPASKCYIPPINIDATQLEYHLFALVTQESRGEVAVVDLTGGGVVDVNQQVPGLNFLVVGQNPTDIASTPDGYMTFVAAAETNKPALYAIPSIQMLGDWDGLIPPPSSGLPLYTSWPACALPQAPGAIAIVPTTGAANAGPTTMISNPSAGKIAKEDAGQPDDITPDEIAPQPLNYQIVAVLPGDALNSAKLVTIDPRPFFAGAGLDPNGQGTPDFNLTPTSSSVLLPGGGDQSTTDGGPVEMPRCPITSAVDLAGVSFIPKTAPAAVAWDDGIKYVDGGAPPEDLPAKYGTICASEAASDGGASIVKDPLTLPLNIAPNTSARGGSSALAGQVYYVADAQLPIIHVFDLRNGTPTELEPLYLTSLIDPARTVTVTQIAVSPVTRDFKRYLYAIDSKDGSIIVFDVSDPVNSSHSPLTRPHAETNPFHAADRIAFTDPVAALTFVHHEWPLAFNQTSQGAPPTGLLCNPNRAAGNATINPDPGATGSITDTSGNVQDLGVFYTANSSISIGPPNVSNYGGPNPYRLRGIFAFATLTTGAMVAIDVDDWDSPCRRPDPMGIDRNGNLPGYPSALTPPEVNVGIGPFDQNHGTPKTNAQSYEAELDGTGSSPVTDENFFPVSAPNRIRSVNFLRNDATFGQHSPYTNSLPLLFDLNGELATDYVGSASSDSNPFMMPTVSTATFFGTNANLIDPNAYSPQPPGVDPTAYGYQLQVPNVTYAYETPDVHVDQTWTITYEGPITAFQGLVGTLALSDCDPSGDSTCQSMTLTQPQALFCRRGVEDFRIGKVKAQAVLAELNDQTKYGNAFTKESAPNLVPVQVPNDAGPDGGDAGTHTVDEPPPYVDTLNSLDQKTGDYVQITDDILNSGDPYWTESACWDDLASMSPSASYLSSSGDQNGIAFNRYISCSNAFGNGLDIQSDLNVQRDYPILEAYEDHLVLGRFGYPNPAQLTTQQRVIVDKDPSNAPFLKFMQCCFHSEIQFQVRTGGEWSAVGSVSSFVHHVTEAPDGSCVLSCNEREALMNSRGPAIPRQGLSAPLPNDPSDVKGAASGQLSLIVDRNSPLAFRNPFFSFVMYNGRTTSQIQDPTIGVDTYPNRDSHWTFAQSGDFQPLSVNLATTTTTVSPQSMKFVEGLGQLAVVDGAAQGLMIIDLDLVQIAHDPYF